MGVEGEPMTPDPLCSATAPMSIWTTTNFAEAMPGVLTPLGWTVFGPVVELGTRAAFRSIGVLSRDESGVPEREEERFLGIFNGRAAGRVDFFCQMGDRLPGASAESMAEQLLSSTPEYLQSAPTRRRYPFIALGLPRTVITSPRALRRFRPWMQAHWTTRIPAIATMDRYQAAAELRRSVDLFGQAMVHQCTVSLMVVQPVFDQLTKLAGDDLHTILGGQGAHEESALVNDLWACSRGGIDEDTLVARYGFHGPLEGEISSRVWREDPTPLLRLVERYAGRPDTEDPHETERRLAAQRTAAVTSLLKRQSRVGRKKARLLIALGDRYVPMRGVGKVAFLQAFDLCRASARRLGTLLETEGLLDDRDDVFYLTLPELLAGAPPADARELVAERRIRRQRYLELELPTHWIGQPTPVPATSAGDDTVTEVTGIGVNAGTVEGIARVITDPADADIEDGEILVARFTDPAWASLMFLSAALVVDIGGTLSHAAVVARELGIPCVVNTMNGTSVLRTGDRVRVDGRTGVVEILERTSSKTVP